MLVLTCTHHLQLWLLCILSRALGQLSSPWSSSRWAASSPPVHHTSDTLENYTSLDDGVPKLWVACNNCSKFNLITHRHHWDSILGRNVQLGIGSNLRDSLLNNRTPFSTLQWYPQSQSITSYRSLCRAYLFQTQGVLQQNLLRCAQLKVCQKAETDLQSRQLTLTHPPDLGESTMRIGQVFKSFHSNTQSCKEKTVWVAPRHWNGALFHS